jgi:glycosyltransferase involved in cell wall biosynthesis
MTICIATDGFSPQVGGIATFNKHLVAALLSAGHTVIVLYIDYDSNDEDRIMADGQFTKVVLRRTYTQYYKKWQPYFRPGGFNAPNWIAIGMAMREWILANQRLYNIDIIEVSDYGGAGIFLCDAALPPVVITGHGSLLQFSKYNFTGNEDSTEVIQQLERLSYVHADAVIAHSPANKEYLNSLCKREIAFSLMPWINEMGLIQKPVQDYKLVVVGGLQPVKGVYEMAAAMEILQRKEAAFTVYWIGGDTWLAPGYQKMSSYLQHKYPFVWQQNFIWKNEQSYLETQNDIAAAALVIIPAQFETFNYVALEAALQKKAMVITDKTGSAFHFTHGRDAWIIPANNADALADAILYLGDHPERCRQLGEKAYDTVHRIFLTQKIVTERSVIYRQTIQNRKNTVPGLRKELSFLDNYHTSLRKYYYCTRQFLKKITGKT